MVKINIKLLRQHARSVINELAIVVKRWTNGVGCTRRRKVQPFDTNRKTLKSNSPILITKLWRIEAQSLYREGGGGVVFHHQFKYISVD